MNSIVFSFESALFALQEHEHLYALAFSESDTLVVQINARLYIKKQGYFR
jgi:hypothetical protein